MRQLIALIVFLVATPAFGSPQYLTCEESKASGGWKLSIAISEEQQVVTYRFENSQSINRSDALFSPSQVWWRNYQSAGIGVTFFLSRVNLQMAIIDHIGETVTTTKGTCTIDPIAKQAV